MRWVVVLLLSGCSSILGIDDFKLGDAGSRDGDGGETGFCLGPADFRVCVAAEPTAPIDNPSTFMFDTAGSPKLCSPATWASPGQPDACFTVGTRVTISASLQAAGDRPYVIFASDSITIDAPLDVASHAGQAASAPGVKGQARCVPAGAGGNGPAGGGAAGGSFMTKGGDGGLPTAAGIAKGMASAADATAPALLRAGCNGGEGGDTSSQQGGTGGFGGGAIYLVAGNRITINSFINASGSPGRGGGIAAGGGGGGSGGMIILHAPTITGNGGILTANGGGGGGGGGAPMGAAGAEPVPNMPAIAAVGGAGGAPGGAGGNGFAGTREATAGVNGAAGASGAGGGGGGGAAGYIRANVALTQITTSPAVSPP